MKLKSFRVTEFKSIIDSNEILINDIGCLVGKNEAGKTALLQALYRLNPIDQVNTDFNVTNDYPRANVSNYEMEVSEGERFPSTVISAEFIIEDSDFIEMGIDPAMLPEKKNNFI